MKRKSIIIIGTVVAILTATCGYSVIQSQMANEVTIKGGNISKSNIVSQENNGVNNEDDKKKVQDKKNSNDGEIMVHIIGRVKKPGIVRIIQGGRIQDAIEAAGGTLQDADLEIVNLAYRLQDGNQVYIPSKINDNLNVKVDSKVKIPSDTNKNATYNKSKFTPGVQGEKLPLKKGNTEFNGVIKEAVKTNEGNNQLTSCVNINTADVKELDTLPGIGPSTAQKIIEYRNTNGSFKKTEDIMKVKGIGKAKYDKVKDKITI